MFTRATSQGVELRFEDEALATQVERWVAALDARPHLEIDRLVVLDGWGLLLTAVDGALVLHASDLAQPPDAPPVYVPRVDVPARFVAQQHELAATLGGAVSAFDPPNALFTVAACPQHAREGVFILERMEPPWPTASGWWLQCGWSGCKTGLASNRMHAADAWKDVSISDIARARPGLVRYLALPFGFVAKLGIADPRVQIGRRAPGDGAVPASMALPLVDLPYVLSYVDAMDVPSPPPRAIALDMARDGAAIDANRVFEGPNLLMERYGIDRACAEATLAHYATDAMRVARARVAFPELTDAEFAAVVAILGGEARSRTKLHQDAGRRLREMNGRPFAELLKLAERVDQRLLELRR